jgi:hypothetical protein
MYKKLKRTAKKFHDKDGTQVDERKKDLMYIPPEFTESEDTEDQEIPDDIQSRLICHVPDFVWSAEVTFNSLY